MTAHLVGQVSNWQWSGSLGLQSNALSCREVHIPRDPALPP